MPTPSHTTPGSAHTRRRTKYAKARIARGLTYADLNAQDFTNTVIANADKGVLPRQRHLRVAYLSAIGLKETD